MKRIVLIIGLIVGSVTLFAQTQPTSADNTVAVNEDSDLVIRIQIHSVDLIRFELS